MSETLSLAFPEVAKGDLACVINRMERMAEKPDGPIRAIRRTPAREGVYSEFPATLNGKLREVLEARGIRQLYCHQAETFDRIAAGGNAVVVTPSASGKTLCYNLP